MNTSFFKEFVVLSETKNYWEASERLYINQSTLTKHIKSMEEELGVPLFDRTTRRVELTSYGEAFLPYAQNMLKQEYEYSSLLLQMKDAQNGYLSLGSIPAMAQYNITNLLLNFQEMVPDSKVRVIEDDSAQLLRLLSEKRCELAFLRESKLSFEKNFLKDEQFVRIPYLRDRLVAILPKNHPLAASPEISLRSLKDDTFCLLKEGTLLYDLSVSACQEAGFIPNVAFTSHRLDSILDMVISGGMVALLANQHVGRPTTAGFSAESPFAIVDISSKIQTQISLCYRRDDSLSPTAKQFVAYCQEHFISGSDSLLQAPPTCDTP